MPNTIGVQERGIMKFLLLILVGMSLFIGCNNLNSGSYPNLPLPPENSSSGDSNGFWVYEGEQVPLSKGSAIHCLSFSEEQNHCYKVRLWISYASSSAPDEWVNLYSVSPCNSYRLSTAGTPELILLGVEKSGELVKARLKISGGFCS